MQKLRCLLLNKTVWSMILILGLYTATMGSTPLVMNFQAQLANNEIGLLQGRYDITVGLYPGDLKTPVWSHLYEQYPVVSGNVFIRLGEDPNNPITSDLFNQPGMRIGITVQGEDVLQSLNAVPYAIQSSVAEVALNFIDKDLIFFDRENKRIGIHNLEPSVELDVSGTVKATKLIGDGSLIQNIQFPEELSIWQKNGNDLYYVSGNVGIGTSNPIADFQVDGTALFTGTVTVNGTLEASLFKGNGAGLTNINATNITSGSLPADILVGNYPLLTGLGTVNSGTWNATPISDIYVNNNLTLENAQIIGTNNVNGVLQTTGPFSITGSYPIRLQGTNWDVSASGNASFESLALNSLIITGNTIQSNTGFGVNLFGSSGTGITVAENGNIGIGKSDPVVALDVNGGIALASSSDDAPAGTIRWDGADLQGKKTTGWVTLTYLGAFDGNSLNAADQSPVDVLYVDNDGKVGIGGNTTPEEHLDVSGNVVFRTPTLIAPDLNVTGPGNRFLWYPKKSALRAGSISGNQWDDANIGNTSVAIGNNPIASEGFTTVIGGGSNSATAVYATIAGGNNNQNSGEYSTIIGGQNNSVSGNFSTIIGGANNTVSSQYSMAAGRRAKASHQGSFVWADSQDSDFETSNPNQFLIRASGGVGIGTETPTEALSVVGTINATAFIGDGSQLTNVNATFLDGYPAALSFSPTSHIYVSTSSGYLPEGVVDTVSVLDYTIQEIDIATGAITSEKILDGTISEADIATGAVTTEKIQDGAITSSKLASGSVDNSALSDNAITSRNIQDGSITTDKIQDGAITNIKIADGAITSRNILDGAITSADIANGAITTDKIADDAITSRNLAPGAVTSIHVATGSITSDLIAPGAITNTILQDNSISSASITANAITAVHIQDGSLSWDKFEDAPIPTSLIATASITGDKIANGTITGDKFQLSTLDSTHIQDNSISSDKIQGVIPVSKGGTGSSSFSEGGIVYYNGSVLTDDADLYWNPTNNYLGIGTNTPSYNLHVIGDALFTGKNLIFRDGGTNNKDFIGFQSVSFAGSPRGFYVFGENEALGSSQNNAGILAKDAYFGGIVGIGTDDPQNQLDVEGSAVIGSSYAGSVSAPVNGLLVEGKVGIGTSNPLAELHVVGSIRADQVIGYGSENGIRGLGGDYGIYGVGTIAGMYGSGGSYGAFGEASTANIGVYGELNDPTSGGRAVYGKTIGAYLSEGALGWIQNSGSLVAAGVYGKQGSGGDYNFAGYFDGNVYIGNNIPTSNAKLTIIGEDSTASNYAVFIENSGGEPLMAVRNDKKVGIGTTTPQSDLHINGATRFEGSVGFTLGSASANTLDWAAHNKIKINPSSNQTYTFTNPPQPTILTLVITYDGTATVTLQTNSGSIKWPGGVIPAPGNTISGSSGTSDIVTLYYDGEDYYGQVSSGFQ